MGKMQNCEFIDELAKMTQSGDGKLSLATASVHPLPVLTCFGGRRVDHSVRVNAREHAAIVHWPRDGPHALRYRVVFACEGELCGKAHVVAQPMTWQPVRRAPHRSFTDRVAPRRD
jgi:hypothetical protein